MADDYFGKKLSAAQKAADFAKKVLEIQARGQVEKGNIDLASRPGVKNPDGSESTVRSMSFSDGPGREVLIPTVVNGKVVSDDEAIAHYRRTGNHMGVFSNPQDATAYAKKVHGDYESGKYGSNVKVNDITYRPAARSLTGTGGYPRQEKQETEEERQNRHNPASRAAWPPEKGQFVQEAQFRNDALMPNSETLGKLHDIVPEAVRNAMGKGLDSVKSYVREASSGPSRGAAIYNHTSDLARPKLQKYLDHVAEPIAQKLSGYEPPEIEFDVPVTTIPETTVTGNSIGRVRGMGGTDGARALRQPRSAEVIEPNTARVLEVAKTHTDYRQKIDGATNRSLGTVDAAADDPREAPYKLSGDTMSGDRTRKNPQADRRVVQDAFDKAVKKGQ